MFNSFSDEQLLTLLKESNIAAFNTIYERYSRPLYLYILSKTDRGETSKDLLQDLFTTLWENVSSWTFISRSVPIYTKVCGTRSSTCTVKM